MAKKRKILHAPAELNKFFIIYMGPFIFKVTQVRFFESEKMFPKGTIETYITFDKRGTNVYSTGITLKMSCLQMPRELLFYVFNQTFP
uniref:Uncharacterized protein n=1 Tax=Glossina palpalis gambiensis TaxID=67801 RepID=A0A1B0AWH3_9MUSC